MLPAVSTELMYIYDDGQRPHLYARARTYRDAHKTDYGGARELVSVNIRNGRHEIGLTLDEKGFELTEHPTTLTTKEFYKNEKKIKHVYFSEICDLVKKKTGASYVHCFDHQVRDGNTSSAKSETQYATDVHTDSSPSDAERTYRDALKDMKKEGVDIASYKQGRFLFINAWRNISDCNKIEDNHLALCDETSLIKPDDYVPYDFYQKEYSGTHYYLASRHANLHRWYYFPGMVQDEVILFKQYDSDPVRKARMCFHSAFRDSTAPYNAPKRESIEVRCMAFFPDHSPNTCPDPDGAVRVACSEILIMVDSLYEWPRLSRMWFNDKMKRNQWEVILSDLVKDKENLVGLKTVSPEMKERVRGMAIAAGFEQHCRTAYQSK